MSRALSLRLALRAKWLWLRRLYPYAWAHAPLCERYGGETFRLGHIFVCRSCGMCALGVTVALAGLIAWPLPGMMAPWVLTDAALSVSPARACSRKPSAESPVRLILPQYR